MVNYIHPTAIIHPTALLGRNNYIGPFCIIGPNVKIADNNHFESHCSIGAPPEHRDFWKTSYQSVNIGSNNMFREFVTVHSGTSCDTIIMNNVVMLTKSHVGHDAFIEDNVNISCFACVGGHSIILKGANLGLHSVIHQNCVVGHYSMIGMGCIVTKKSLILPCSTYVGNPARKLKLNDYAIKKHHITGEMVYEYEMDFQQALRELHD